MITRLTLLKDNHKRAYSSDMATEIGMAFCGLCLIAIPVILLPMAWKFAFLGVVVVGGFYYMSTIKQQPNPFVGVIEFTADSITLMYAEKEDLSIALSDIALLVVWSDYYPGFTYMSVGRRASISNGHLQLTIKLKDGSEITKQCLITDSLHYKAVVSMLKIWYSRGVTINEFVTLEKYMGFLMEQQSTYTFAELQAAKAELGIS